MLVYDRLAETIFGNQVKAMQTLSKAPTEPSPLIELKFLKQFENPADYIAYRLDR